MLTSRNIHRLAFVSLLILVPLSIFFDTTPSANTFYLTTIFLSFAALVMDWSKVIREPNGQ